MNYAAEALRLHEAARGKLRIAGKVEVNTPDKLCLAYTPGVAEPCRKIHACKEDVYRYTAKGNLVAVVSDGSAVLGLGNIGPEAAMPVMEGKALLFRQFGKVDAFPICLDTQDTEEIIRAVRWLAPTFGGINLEDISSPRCFEIERRLAEELDIPVFHDDQHGTAIVVTAALMNATRLTGRRLEDLKVVLNGPGAAGTAIIKMIMYAGVKNVLACDEHGILSKYRIPAPTGHKLSLCETTNPEDQTGSLADAVVGADVFIGVSVADALTPAMIATMAKDPIVFAMANPSPEIAYETAIHSGVKVMGTGRSDCPNQINNVLAFPGIFRGALDVGAKEINYAMKMAAAEAIAGVVEDDKLSPEYIIPSAFDERVVTRVAQAVAQAARESGALRMGRS